MFSDPQKNIDALHLKLGAKVADLGSGSGHYALAAMRAVGEKGKVYAIDIQKDMLTRLQNEAKRQGFDNVEIIWGDIDAREGTHLADASVDAAIISNLLFQLQDKDAVAIETMRIVRSGGELLLVEWKESFGGLGPHTDQIVSQDAAEMIFAKAGFSKDREIEAGAHHYGIIFTKQSHE